MNYVYITAFTGNIISFVAATCLTWSSPITSKLQDYEDTPFDTIPTDDDISWVSSLLALGAAFGPFIFGYLADKIGRKYTLIVCAVPFLVCYFLLAFAKIIELYYVARFIMGLSLGGVFTVIPMYVGEIADDSNRGALGSAMNCFLTMGLLFSYVLGPYVSVTVFNIVLAIFPGIFLVLFFFVAPESPHYYVSNHKHDLAKSALQKIRGTDDVEKELTEMQMKIKEEGQGTFFDIFKSKGLIKAFVISVTLIAFQQLSGINAVLFFAQSIFTQAGSTLKAAVCSIIIGGIQFGASFVTPLVCERLGRKVLLLISGIGMMIAEVPLGLYGYLKDHDHDVSSINFLPILCLIIYIISYNFGFGPIPWALMGELFPSSVKSIASSLTAGICYLIGFLIAKYFQALSNAIGMSSFWIFASFCALSIPFVMFYVLETKGKSLQEIQNALND